MKIKIQDLNNNYIIEKETNGLPWIDCDFETETCVFFPQEIAIEVGFNFVSENGGEVHDYGDVRHDIECYFTNYIEDIFDKTIELLESYGDAVK